MIVVITTWLPRRACSQPGMNAQAPPNSAAAAIASGSTSANGSQPNQSPTSATPRPPRYA